MDARGNRMTDAVLICPGQGAQRPGGLADLADLPARFRLSFDLASEIVNRNLWQLGQSSEPADVTALRRPSLLQPYLIAWAATEYAAAQDRIDDRIACVTGHSSGLNSAIALSGATSLEAALRFAYECGRAMDRDCLDHPGGLLALVGADRATAEAIASESGAVLANHNASDQTVLGGSERALARAAGRAPERGVQAVALRVAGAFHTPVFRSSDRANRVLIDRLQLADEFTPIVGNHCGQLIQSPEQLREELRGQYTRPVEWYDALETLYQQGVRRFLTLGPGNVMAGLVRRYAKSQPEPITITRLSQLTH